MQFVISKQIAVEAETPEEAVAKISEGKTISFTVSPRPTPVARPMNPNAPQFPQGQVPLGFGRPQPTG